MSKLVTALAVGLTEEKFLANVHAYVSILTADEFVELKAIVFGQVSKPSVAAVEPTPKSTLELVYRAGSTRAWVVKDGKVAKVSSQRVYFKVNKAYTEAGKFIIGQGKVASSGSHDKVVEFLMSEQAKGSFVVVFKPRADRYVAYEQVAKTEATHAFDFKVNSIVAL